jgi:hypothetical protein
MTNKDELDALKARIEELERASKPPAPPDPRDWQLIDRTSGMSMPQSALQEMAAAVPDALVRDIAMRDGRAPSGPSSEGAIPSSQQVSGTHPGGGPANTSGWRDVAPLSPPAGTFWVDAIAIADDVKQRK